MIGFSGTTIVITGLFLTSPAMANTSSSWSDHATVPVGVHSETVSCSEDGTMILEWNKYAMDEYTTLPHSNRLSMPTDSFDECSRNREFLLHAVDNPIDPTEGSIHVPSGVVKVLIQTTEIPVSSGHARKWDKVETLFLNVYGRTFTSRALGECSERCHVFASAIHPGNPW